MGDIIKLRQSETSPCDMLVIAAEEKLNGKSICRCDTILDDGVSSRVIKEALSLTRAFSFWTREDRNIKMFLNKIYGRVRYLRKSSDGSITGTFKLKTDPRIEEFDDTNIIRRGSLLKSNHVYGLVLYNCGNSPKGSSAAGFKKRKRSSIEKKIENYSLTLALLSLVVTLMISLIQQKSNRKADKRVRLLDSKVDFLNDLILLMSCFPWTCSIMMRLFQLATTRLVHAKYRGFSASKLYRKLMSAAKVKLQAKADGEHSFKVINPDIIPDLGDIDHAFFDKTNTLTTDSFHLKSILVDRKLYLTKNSSFKDAIKLLDENALDAIDYLDASTPLLFRHESSKPAFLGEIHDPSPHRLETPRFLAQSRSLELMDSNFLSQGMLLDDGKQAIDNFRATGLEVFRAKKASSFCFEKKDVKKKVYDEADFVLEANNGKIKDLLRIFALCHKARATQELHR